MKYTIGKSHAGQAKAAVDEATRGFQSPKLILYFSPVDHFEEYTEFIYEKFPNSICMGSTTKVALSKTEGDLKGLLVVGIENGIKCCAGVLTDVDKYPIKSVGEVQRCVKEIGTTKNTMCLEMTQPYCVRRSRFFPHLILFFWRRIFRFLEDQRGM